MSIPVIRYQRNKMLGDDTSPLLYYLKRVPGHHRIYTEEDLAREIETTGAMSAEDVIHVFKATKRCLRTFLTRGDKVKIDGLGTFFITFSCVGTEEEKDCTIRNIKRVNVRFAIDNTLRLVNESNASTRGGANNVEFFIKGDTGTNGNNSGNADVGNGGNTGGGTGIDPDA